MSEDALGPVFRAIYAPDERRFVRLRILQSPEIAPEAVLSAIGRDENSAPLAHRAIVPNFEVGLADGVPYAAWDEVAGSTLDQLFDRVRALGEDVFDKPAGLDVRIPPEYALLVAERIASALEFAHRCTANRPTLHGLVWPGFVSISGNAEIRLGGFGLGEALLNSIHRPRMAREIAPYASPEARETGEVAPDSDVYSLGVLLVELLTGRRPRRHDPAAALDDFGPVPEELSALIRRALAPSGERFPSIVEMHRAVQELLTASPYALYTGNLALFLYRLLNPEGQNVVDAADGDCTNPVDSFYSAEADTDRSLPARNAPDETGPFEKERSEPRFAVAVALAPDPLVEAAVAARRASVGRSRVGLAVAASLLAALVLPAHRSGPPPSQPVAAAQATATPVVRAEDPTLLANGTAATPAVHTAAALPARAAKGAVGGGSVRDRAATAALARRSAEGLRLRAALARIEAERLDAESIARELYTEAQDNEQEGNRLLRKGVFEQAQPPLLRATQLYRMAEDVSREERVRLVRLSSSP